MYSQKYRQVFVSGFYLSSAVFIGNFVRGNSNLGHLERGLSNHRQDILPEEICGKRFFSLSSCSHDSERHFTDLAFPKSFKDTTASMPLVAKNDYFVREGTDLERHGGNS